MTPTILIMLLFGGFLLLSTSRHGGLVAPLLVGFALRFAACLYALNWEMPFDGTDSRNFEGFANQFGAWGWAGWVQLFPGISSFFCSWLMAASGLLLGWSKESFLLLSFVPSVLLVRSTYLLGLELSEGEPRPAIWGAWVVARHPNLIVFSASLLREAMVQWLLVGTTLWMVRYARGHSLRSLFTAVAIILASVFLHAALILGALPLAWVIAGKMESVRGAKILRNIVLVSVLAIFFVMAADVTLPKIGSLASIISLEGANTAIAARAHLLTGGSAYPQWLVPNSAFELVTRLPLLIIYFLFGPFLWDAVNISERLAAIDGILVFAAFFLIWRLRHRLLGAPAGRAISIFAGFLIVLFAASVFNQGTAVRHRAKFTAIIAITACAAIGWGRKEREMRRITHARQMAKL